jgi:hypothetical protein
MDDKLVIKYSWKTVSKSDLKGCPAVYRFVFPVGKNNREHYYGETANLKKRAYQYNHPHSTQSTNLRLNEKINTTNIAMQIVKITYLKINNSKGGVLISKDNEQEKILKSQFVRRFLENYFTMKSKTVDRKIIVNKGGLKHK